MLKYFTLMEVIGKKVMSFNPTKLLQDSIDVRRIILNLCHETPGGHHFGGSLSLIEIMCYLYGYKLNISTGLRHSHERDIFIFSKGHCVLAYYPVLYKYGLISKETLYSYKTPGSDLISHPIKNLDFAIESSNGSLGHGLSYACGVAHGLKYMNSKACVYVIIGDGECNEGSIWEAAICAPNLKLDNLTAIVDKNNFQSDGSTDLVSRKLKLADAFASFGWHTSQIDGHNMNEIHSSLSSSSTSTSCPNLIIANTIKGKGISFMENSNEWHHSVLTSKSYQQAIKELDQ